MRQFFLPTMNLEDTWCGSFKEYCFWFHEGEESEYFQVQKKCPLNSNIIVKPIPYEQSDLVQKAKSDSAKKRKKQKENNLPPPSNSVTLFNNDDDSEYDESSAIQITEKIPKKRKTKNNEISNNAIPKQLDQLVLQSVIVSEENNEKSQEITNDEKEIEELGDEEIVKMGQIQTNDLEGTKTTKKGQVTEMTSKLGPTQVDAEITCTSDFKESKTKNTEEETQVSNTKEDSNSLPVESELGDDQFTILAAVATATDEILKNADQNENFDDNERNKYLTEQFSFMKKKMLDFCEKKKTIMPQTNQEKSRVFWKGGYIDLTAYDIVIGDEEFQKPITVKKSQSINTKNVEKEKVHKHEKKSKNILNQKNLEKEDNNNKNDVDDNEKEDNQGGKTIENGS